MVKIKHILVLAFVLIYSAAFTQGKLLNKMLAKVAKKVGDTNVASTATLDELVLMGGI
jgi:hypothetical protein